MDTPDRSNGHIPARRPKIAAEVTPVDVDHEFSDVPPPPGKKVSARLVWRALRRHWWQAVLLWAVGSAGLMGLAYYKVKPTYEAVARVRIEQGERGLFKESGSLSDFAEFKETQVALITSPTVIGTALAANPQLLTYPRLRQSPDAEAEIRQSLTVVIVPKTNLIQIAMSTESPLEGVAIVNAVVDAYLKHATAVNDDETTKRIERLRQTRDDHKKEVERLRSEVKRLGDKLGSADVLGVKDHNRLTLDQYRKFNEQLTEVEIKWIAAKADLDRLRAERIAPPRSLDPERVQQAVRDAFYSHPRVVPVQERRALAERKYKDAARVAKSPSDPARVKFKKAADEAAAEIDNLWAQLGDEIQRQVMNGTGTSDDSEKAILEAESRLSALESQQKALNAKLEQMSVDHRTVGSEQLNLEFTRSDMKRAEDVLDRVEASLHQLVFESKSPIARIHREFDAKPSNKANSNSRMKVMALAPVGVLFAVMGLLVLIELRGGRIADPDELTSRVHLQVIGVVPPLPQLQTSTGTGVLARRDEFRAQRQLDEFVQSLDHLRVALCAGRDAWGRDRRCVLITSACGSEGKTTLAAQLAERCVNAGLMTLLIDADLRNPTLSRMLDAPDNQGLINVLRDEVAAEDVMMVIGDAGGFHFLPAGTPRVDPSRLLQGDRLGKLLAQARESFDMIIVDAPPVLPVPDALTIGRWTDGAVLAVRYDTSRFPLVERANRRLAHVGVPVIGAVVNGVRSVESSYGYGGYYAYGSSGNSQTESPLLDA